MDERELEFLKYVYENIAVDELVRLQEGFKADTGKSLPQGYELSDIPDPSDFQEFWNSEEDKCNGNCNKCNH